MERLDAVEKVALINLISKKLKNLKPYKIDDLPQIKFYMKIAKKLDFPEDFIEEYDLHNLITRKD